MRSFEMQLNSENQTDPHELHIGVKHHMSLIALFIFLSLKLTIFLI